MLLDEVQNLPDWIYGSANFTVVWKKFDNNAVVTAKMLSSEMATVLTGGVISRLEMLPFSLDETMRWKKHQS